MGQEGEVGADKKEMLEDRKEQDRAPRSPKKPPEPQDTNCNAQAQFHSVP